MFSGSGPGAVDAFAAYWREVDEKARLVMDLEAEATERPEPRRIRERADAIVGVGSNELRQEGTIVIGIVRTEVGRACLGHVLADITRRRAKRNRVMPAKWKPRLQVLPLPSPSSSNRLLLLCRVSFSLLISIFSDLE